MANYVGVGRSNYFAVSDEREFKAWADKFGIHTWEKDDNPELKAFEGNEESGFLEYTDEDDNQWSTEEILGELQPILTKSTVCVFMCVGNEKLRYLNGCSFAVSRDKVIKISLDDIYQKAVDEFGIPMEDITEAVY